MNHNWVFDSQLSHSFFNNNVKICKQCNSWLITWQDDLIDMRIYKKLIANPIDFKDGAEYIVHIYRVNGTLTSSKHSSTNLEDISQLPSCAQIIMKHIIE